MIYVGVTGWGDHDRLYGPHTSPRNKLQEYAGFFPTVEVDASFYAIQPLKNAERWVEQTPEHFQFIVKAYQGMTGHARGEIPFDSKEAMFAAFKDSLQPYIANNKLAMALFQFPPWFDCKRENVEYLRWCKKQMEGIPCALEFRNQSWFRPALKDRTLAFLKEENWIHSICDEPQVGEGSVPKVLETLNQDKTLIRFHGRNEYGWQVRTENWREVRYLYRYNREELLEWADHIRQLDKKTNSLYIVFNNNSGGDAAENALELIEILGIEYENLAPRQLDLF